MEAFLGSLGLSVTDGSNLRDAKSGTETGAYEPVCLGRGSRFLPFPPTQTHTRAQRTVAQHQIPQSVGRLGLHFLSSCLRLASCLCVSGACSWEP